MGASFSSTEPAGLYETLGTGDQEGGPLGDLRGGQNHEGSFGFPKTSSIINSYKRCEPLDGIVVLLEVYSEEIRRNLDFCPMRL